MVLHEGTNDITFNYLDFMTGTARNGLAIGIQGSQYSYLQYGWFAASQLNCLPESGFPQWVSPCFGIQLARCPGSWKSSSTG